MAARQTTHIFIFVDEASFKLAKTAAEEEMWVGREDRTPQSTCASRGERSVEQETHLLWCGIMWHSTTLLQSLNGLLQISGCLSHSCLHVSLPDPSRGTLRRDGMFMTTWSVVMNIPSSHKHSIKTRVPKYEWLRSFHTERWLEPETKKVRTPKYFLMYKSVCMLVPVHLSLIHATWLRSRCTFHFFSILSPPINGYANNYKYVTWFHLWSK